MKKRTKAFISSVEQELGHAAFVYQAKLWDKKLARLDDEMLIYIIQSATYKLNQRADNETV